MANQNKLGKAEGVRSALVISFMLIAVATGLFASQNVSLPLLPRPANITTHANKGFVITPQTPLIVNAPELDRKRIIDYASKSLFGTPISSRGTPISSGVASQAITFSIVYEIDGIDSPEGYSLSVTNDGIDVEALSGAGLFYGLVSLIQLAENSDVIPSLEIKDFPRFGYRGLMLDISRNFRDKEFIKKQIDALSQLKINRLHLHLTDAAGWRIRINEYPLLTSYAAWRPRLTWKEWNDSGRGYVAEQSPLAYGGYLSQDEAREIVEYAADRYITVIPEIELPSHSEEVTAAYPEISCSGSSQSDVCIGNEKTFEFFEKIFDEIIAIFPSEYIHIGGDEASKEAWKTCELCLARMKEEGLETVDELQAYMIERIEKYLNSKGRQIIGWDEIMEGRLAPNATVMSWRGTEGGIKAAREGHNSVMTPGAYCYLDMYQDAPPTQPEANSGYIPLEKVYSYNPAPDSLPASVREKIIGVQGNLWSEYIPTAAQAEYMLYPRITAIAEIGWTPQELREWDDFHRRAGEFNGRLHRKGYHVFDLREEVGQRREAAIEVDHLAKGKKVTYNVPWWSRYNANFEKTLTDGRRGGWSYGDQCWQGFLYKGNQRVDVTIDLDEDKDISYIVADFMQIIGPGVWFPETVEISVSEDGETFIPLTKITHEPKATPGLSFKTYSWEGKAKGRFVRYVAEASEGCQFTDEIIIL